MTEAGWIYMTIYYGPIIDIRGIWGYKLLTFGNPCPLMLQFTNFKTGFHPFLSDKLTSTT